MREEQKPVISHPTEFEHGLDAASVRVMLAAALSNRDVQIEEVLRLLEQTSDEIRFNRELVKASLEHLSLGVSVVDKNLRLVAWNRRYVEFFDYPESLITAGRPIEEIILYNGHRGLLGAGDIEEKVAKRIAYMREGQAYYHQREMPNGRVVEIRGNPMPGGGFVTSYSDVTAYKQAQRELEQINETLEVRVAERTAELVQANEALREAKAAAERANQTKTRFLASASHDLVQPLNAARLFIASIDRRKLGETEGRLMEQVESSLSSAESLLGALLDISRLDAAAHDLKSEHFSLNRVMEPLATEFGAFAKARGLAFHVVPTKAIVNTDPRLLRRVLQNFLSNAVRYTRRGRILLGCRRVDGALRIEVWDTGPGIPEDKQKEIFEEFRRLDTVQTGTERGLGLGLAIADRMARLMGLPLNLRSWPGRGSVFSVTVPLGDSAQIAPPKQDHARQVGDRLFGTNVLVLENEPDVLEGMRTLLSGWGAHVIAVRDFDSAEKIYRTQLKVPSLALIDYHLDIDQNGIEVFKRMQQMWGRKVPGIVITADHTQQARSHAMEEGLLMLPKPVKPAALRALMTRALSNRSPD